MYTLTMTHSLAFFSSINSECLDTLCTPHRPGCFPKQCTQFCCRIQAKLLSSCSNRYRLVFQSRPCLWTTIARRIARNPCSFASRKWRGCGWTCRADPDLPIRCTLRRCRRRSLRHGFRKCKTLSICPYKCSRTCRRAESRSGRLGGRRCIQSRPCMYLLACTCLCASRRLDLPPTCSLRSM